MNIYESGKRKGSNTCGSCTHGISQIDCIYVKIAYIVRENQENLTKRTA